MLCLQIHRRADSHKTRFLCLSTFQTQKRYMDRRQVQAAGILPTSSVEEILRALGMDKFEPKVTEYGGKRLVDGHTWMEEEHVVSNTETLLREEEANVITLTGLEIFPKIQGDTILGTLEVHVNGFNYATSNPNFCVSFYYADVETTLYRFGDEKTPPLLHFHFHKGIKVGTEKRRDIQFRLGQARFCDDSFKSNEDLKKFVHNVVEKWRGVRLLHLHPFVEAEVHKAYEFQGNCPSKAPTVFGLTPFFLVGLLDEPFIVVNLFKIQVVHLRHKRDELSKPVEIDMIIVFPEFYERDPVQINSIPIDKLHLIKDSCNRAGVKCCENDYDIGRCSIGKQRADSPPWMLADRNYYNAGHETFYTSDGEEYLWED